MVKMDLTVKGTYPKSTHGISGFGIVNKIAGLKKAYWTRTGKSAEQDGMAIMMSPATWAAIVDDPQVSHISPILTVNSRKIWEMYVILTEECPIGQTYFVMPEEHRFLQEDAPKSAPQYPGGGGSGGWIKSEPVYVGTTSSTYTMAYPSKPYYPGEYAKPKQESAGGYQQQVWADEATTLKSEDLYKAVNDMTFKEMYDNALSAQAMVDEIIAPKKKKHDKKFDEAAEKIKDTVKTVDPQKVTNKDYVNGPKGTLYTYTSPVDGQTMTFTVGEQQVVFPTPAPVGQEYTVKLSDGNTQYEMKQDGVWHKMGTMDSEGVVMKEKKK